MYSEKDILSMEVIKGMSDGELVSGLMYLKDYTKKPTKNGGFFIDGTSEVKGAIQFKAWGNSVAFSKMDEEDYTDHVVWVNGKVNLFGGAISLIIDDLNAVEAESSGITEADFFYSKYNGKAYMEAIRKSLVKMAGEKALKAFNILIGDIEESFIQEFAAKGHHDNCRSGLVAHTYKVLYIGKVLKMYQNIMTFEGTTDLLYLGCAIHDIGKTVEYKNGSVVGLGRICSHHTFGVEMLMKHKDELISLYDEEFFYRLCAIVEQHHGEFEESPRTFEAYIIHLIDKFESDLQFIDQSLEGFERGSQLTVNCFKLS